MRLRAYIIGTLLAITVVASAAQNYKVIVNASNDRGTVAKQELSNIFLKKKKTWDNGTPIVVVDQQEKSPVREVFTTIVHGKSVAAIKSYWQQQIFSGRDVPPVEKASDSDVMAFVRANPGAIGYVDGDVAVTGVKVLNIQ